MIGQIEDTLVATVRQALPQLRVVESLPGQLNEFRLRELTRSVPGVWFAFLGGRQDRNLDEVHLDARFGMYVATGHASGHHERRRGRGNDIGAYEILTVALPLITGMTIDGAGTVSLQQVENLFNLKLEREQAACLYAAVFGIPLPLQYQLDETGLDDFAIYHAEHSLVAGEDEPDAIDNVNMPQ